MVKTEEISNPNSCLSKAKDHEILFTLRAHDEAAPAAIRYWVLLRIAAGKNVKGDEQTTEALRQADEMEVQRTSGTV